MPVEIFTYFYYNGDSCKYTQTKKEKDYEISDTFRF